MSARLDLTPLEFHAQVLSPVGTYYVDPFHHAEADGTYVSYFKSDALRNPQCNFVCLVHDIGIKHNQHDEADHSPASEHAENCSGPGCAIVVLADSDARPDLISSGSIASDADFAPLLSHGTQLRTYDLAVAGTGEYTAFHGGIVEAVMSAIFTTMNRVNGIVETDIATRMILVANNDQLVYTNASTDPYTNSNGFSMLSENQSNVDSVIGDANVRHRSCL